MKKVLLAIILLCILTGCSNVSNNNNMNEDNRFMDNIYFSEIEWCGINWDQIQFSVDLNEMDVVKEIKPIETKDVAVDLGIKIIEEFHKKGRFSSYTLLSIVHSTKDNIWRFDYSIDQRDKDVDDLIDCGGLYIAIDGNSGTIAGAWIE